MNFMNVAGTVVLSGKRNKTIYLERMITYLLRSRVEKKNEYAKKIDI